MPNPAPPRQPPRGSGQGDMRRAPAHGQPRRQASAHPTGAEV